MPARFLMDVGLVDDVADQVGAERGASAAMPIRQNAGRSASLAGRLLEQQPADQSRRAVAVRKQRLKLSDFRRIRPRVTVRPRRCLRASWRTAADPGADVRAQIESRVAISGRDKRDRRAQRRRRQCELALPGERMGDDGVEIVQLRLPAEHHPDALGAGDDRGRIAGPAVGMPRPGNSMPDTRFTASITSSTE